MGAKELHKATLGRDAKCVTDSVGCCDRPEVPEPSRSPRSEQQLLSLFLVPGELPLRRTCQQWTASPTAVIHAGPRGVIVLCENLNEGDVAGWPCPVSPTS